MAATILEKYTFTLPEGAALGELALLANGELSIEDRVRIVDSDGAPASAANAGNLRTAVGVEASLGDLVSVGTVELRDRAKILGDLVSGAQITPGNGVLVTGSQQANASGLLPGNVESLEVDFGGTSHGSVLLEPPSSGVKTTNLAVGRYDQVVVKSRNRVVLTAGEYVLNALQLEPQASLIIDDSDGPVMLSIRDSLLYKGTIEGAAGHPALRVTYVGSNSVVLESPFTGMLLAPNASIRLATLGTGKKHVGAFFAKNLLVSPDVLVEFRPFYEYRATQDFEIATSSYGRFGYVAFAADGSINARVSNNVIKAQPSGDSTKLLKTDLSTMFLIDPATGSFGYYGDQSFSRFSPDGSLLGTYPTSRHTHAYFVPGGDMTAVLLSNDAHEPEYTAIRVFSGKSSWDIATPGLQQFGVSSSSLVYATATEVFSLSHSGVQLFRIPLALRELIVAPSGAIYGVRAEQGSSKLVSVDPSNGSTTELMTIDAALWSLVVAPSGKYLAAATQTKLYVFKNNTLLRSQALPFQYFASADINDQGDVVVGGATKNNTVLMLIGASGTRAWVDSSGLRDNIAMRPYVHFQPKSDDFVAVRKEGLSRYTVTRSL